MACPVPVCAQALRLWLYLEMGSLQTIESGGKVAWRGGTSVLRVSGLDTQGRGQAVGTGQSTVSPAGEGATDRPLALQTPRGAGPR